MVYSKVKIMIIENIDKLKKIKILKNQKHSLINYIFNNIKYFKTMGCCDSKTKFEDQTDLKDKKKHDEVSERNRVDKFKKPDHKKVEIFTTNKVEIDDHKKVEFHETKKEEIVDHIKTELHETKKVEIPDHGKFEEVYIPKVELHIKPDIPKITKHDYIPEHKKTSPRVKFVKSGSDSHEKLEFADEVGEIKRDYH